MSEAGKILAVLGSHGAGKATTIGNLIYKCGGIDMPTLERLEKGRNNGYARAFNEIKARNEKLYFYTPNNKITVTDKQLQEIGDQLNGMASHKMVVLVNKLDEVDWSEDAFTDSVRVTNAVLQSLGVSKEQYDTRR
ncbi:Elongation factor 1-alpha [Pyrenophora tritici-repentis]|nr:Elongation factor 1-alpha [Pyrenophora tritici-repentis]